MSKLEETMKVLESQIAAAACSGNDTVKISRECADRILFFLRQVKGDASPDMNKLLMHIADTQLLNAPDGFHSKDDEKYMKGVWDGLEIAYNIVLEWSRSE